METINEKPGTDIQDLIPMIETTVYDMVRELRAQHARWGIQNHDDPVWLEILLEELGEACRESATRIGSMHGRSWLLDVMQLGDLAKAKLERSPASQRERHGLHTEGAYAELIQVAAVALQWAACIKRLAIAIDGGTRGEEA